MTDVFEGSLIRVFRRLQELIRQMSMGEPPLAACAMLTGYKLLARSDQTSSSKSSTTRSSVSSVPPLLHSLRLWYVVGTRRTRAVLTLLQYL